MAGILRLGLLILSTLLFSTIAIAQKGVGESTGVAKQTVKPATIELSGKLLEIKTGPCEKTTGRSPIGAHLFIQDKDGVKLNIHLGPINAVDHVFDQLIIGESLKLDVFRTDQLPKDAFIAKSIILDNKVINLRDDNLRPSWAYPQGKGQRGSQNMDPARGKMGRCW
ncbi:hypothetical protein ACQKP8_12390 [Photobacterium alginatilyticum]|uniref:hypothetical protein n=1 Tax=Photobacterium alginatilyticum TaxID=1775171 RepID=UPI00406774D0